jgi:hypothetical protein
MAAIWAQKDADGNPLYTGQLKMVVPPQLAVVAKNILNATELRNSLVVAPPGGDQFTTTNWINGEIAEVVVNPWLPIVDTTKGHHVVPVRRPGRGPPGDGGRVPVAATRRRSCS